jgi:S-adenosyl methyltransferase
MEPFDTSRPNIARVWDYWLGGKENHGIGQFIDVGAGLPTALNTHDIAQHVNPQARMAYVDYDPVVISHARSLLAKSPGVIAVPGDILGGVGRKA